MNKNPYQTPASTVEQEYETSADNAQFYIVSVKKFTILFFATLGLYTLYWFYKNWSEYKRASDKSIWPVPRALFNIFFTHSLFREVQYALTAKGKTFDWGPASLATAYVLVSIVSNILDRMSMRGVGSPVSDILSLLILPVMYFTLVQPQRAVNFSQGDPEGSSNSRLTAGNYAWIVIGLVIWSLNIIGLASVFGLIS